MSPQILRDFRLEISSVFFILSVVGLVIVISGNFFHDQSPAFLRDLDEDVGNWIIWLDVLSPLVCAISGWYLFDTIIKGREFERLMETQSKATFVRNQSRIEDIMRVLPSRYQARVREKKKRLKIRD